MIEPGHPAASVRRRCKLLGLMRRIDKLYTARPFWGSRRLTAWLIEQGEKMSRKRLKRLMRTLGLEALDPERRAISRFSLTDHAVRASGHAWSRFNLLAHASTSLMTRPSTFVRRRRMPLCSNVNAS